MVNSKKKGSAGELELVHFFKEHGIRAHRSQQFCGRGEDASDVILDDFKALHVEVKRTEALHLYPAVDQARDDSAGKLPIVAHRRNKKPWVFIIEADTLIEFLKRHKLILTAE